MQLSAIPGRHLPPRVIHNASAIVPIRHCNQDKSPPLSAIPPRHCPSLFRRLPRSLSYVYESDKHDTYRPTNPSDLRNVPQSCSRECHYPQDEVSSESCISYGSTYLPMHQLRAPERRNMPHRQRAEAGRV